MKLYQLWGCKKQNHLKWRNKSSKNSVKISAKTNVLVLIFKNSLAFRQLLYKELPTNKKFEELPKKDEKMKIFKTRLKYVYKWHSRCWFQYFSKFLNLLYQNDQRGSKSNKKLTKNLKLSKLDKFMCML